MPLRLPALAAALLLAAVTGAAAQSQPSPPPLDLSGIPQRNLILGEPRAPVKVLAFVEPKCPVCAAAQRRLMPQVLHRFVRTGRVRLVFEGMHFLGADSLTGDRYVLAAGLQGHLWDELGGVLANQGEETSAWLTPALAEAIAGTIPGLDVARLRADAAGSVVAAELRATAKLVRHWGVSATPTYVFERRGRPAEVMIGYSASEFARDARRLLNGA